MIKSYKREPTFRQYSSEGFRVKLGQFYKFIEDFTYIDEELNPEERQQLLQSRFTNGYTPFLQLVRKLFGNDVHTQDIKAVFRKIATNPDVVVDWGELFGINASLPGELHEIKKPNEAQDVFTLDSKTVAGQAGGDRRSRENIKCITYSHELNIFVTITLHGIACHWNSKFRFKSSVDIGESSWATGCCILPDLRKIAISTERSIVIWNYRAKGKESNIFHIKPIDSPQCIIRVPWKQNPGIEDYILFGDEQGFVNLLTLNVKDFQMGGRVDKDHAEMANVIDPDKLTSRILRRKFHDDWVIQLKYFPQLQMFGSCSTDRECSFVLSRLDNLMDTRPVREMSLPKGVNCFVYCVRANAIVTGGVDKILRIWHPIILSRPTGKLIGHLFTVTDISVNERDQHLISLSTARIFRIWDLQKMQCLQTFAVGENLTAENRTCVMQFDSKYDRLITGTNIIELWPLNRDQDSQVVPHTHEQGISCMLYNENLNQVVSACIDCILKVWEMETGHLVYTLKQAHGSKSAYVSAMVSDDTGQRLITAAQDGSLRLWDCISSHLLKSYNPAISQMSQICDVAYQIINGTNYIFAATSSRSVRVYEDAVDTIAEIFILSDSAVQIQVERISLGNTPERTPDSNRKKSNESKLLGGGLKRQASYLSGVFLSSDITCMDISHQDNLLAAGFSNGNIYIWNTENRTLISSNNDTLIHSCILSSWENGIPLNKLFILGGDFFIPPRGYHVLKRAEVIAVRITNQQLFHPSSSSNGWTKDSICCLKFLVYETVQKSTESRSRASAVTTAQIAAEPEGKNELRSFSIAKSTSTRNEPSLSQRDAVKLSIVTSHPAYGTNSVNADVSSTGKDNDVPVQSLIRITRLLVCSENGSVTLITVEGDILMQVTVANAVQRTRCVTAIREVRDQMYIYSGDTMGYLTCWNLTEFWKINAELASSESEDTAMLTNQERLLEELQLAQLYLNNGDIPFLVVTREERRIATLSSFIRNPVEEKQHSEQKCNFNHNISHINGVLSPMNEVADFNQDSIEQTLTWRAHQMKITNIEYIKTYDIVLSASRDGSVRMWHSLTGHFLGFFGQSKSWHLSNEMLIPPSPVQPHDISEAPLKPLSKLRLTNINTRPELAKCPLAFDLQRWTNSTVLPAIKEKEGPKDKKFFSSLSKPRHYNSHLENSSVKTSYGSNSVFRTLPVYKVQSPKRLKTPKVKVREPTWFKNMTKTNQNSKRKKNAATFRMKSPKKEVKPVVRFPHIVPGFKD